MIKKFKRKRDQRKALLKALAEALILHGKIKTTEAKAKELRPYIEKKLTHAKKGGLANQRYLLRYFSKRSVKKLINEYGRKYVDRNGGYTRIIKLPLRDRDASKIALIEFV